MMRSCPVCRGTCIQIVKLDIRKIDHWVVETKTYPCSYCGGQGCREVEGERRKGRRFRRRNDKIACEICGEVYNRSEMTRHHLKPKSLNKNGACHMAKLCKTCHTTVHNQFSNEELDSKYFTLEKLKRVISFPKSRGGPVAKPGVAAAF